jgi:putative ABC transport system permease protein
MIKNHIKIAWRNLWKHRAYSTINIVGLSIGLTACLIVATVVFDELSYDNQWKKGNDIYRVLSAASNIKGEELMPVAFAGLGPALKKEMPDVEDYCRMQVNKRRLKFDKEAESTAVQSLTAEPSIWNILDFKVIKGNPQKFVKGYANLIITEKIQKQYFTGQNPIGNIVYSVPEYGKPVQYLITGIIKDLPRNTHLRADILILHEYGLSDNQMPKKDGGYSFFPQYILLRHGTSITSFTNKVNQWYTKQAGNGDFGYTFQFQPIKDVYLKSDFNGVQAVHSSMRTVYIFSGVAILLLIIACINFINLTISRVFNRAKETGIRKVLGAAKFQLIIHFLTESILFFVISFAFALLLYPLLLKPVETYLGHQLVLNLYNSTFLILTICSVLLVSVLTGLYPAWFLSRPQPITILRNRQTQGFQLNLLKKALVVGQFVISVTIILVTIVVYKQLSFISKKDLGFDKNNLVNIASTNWGEKGALFKQSVKQLPGVESVSLSEWYPTSGAGGMSRAISIPGQKDKVNAYFIEGDADLPATLKLKLKYGRMLNPDLLTHAMNSDSAINGLSTQTKALIKVRPCLATNYTAALLALKINKPAGVGEGIPIGIVEDFNSESLHTKLQPTFIQAASNPTWGNMLIRIKPGFEKRVLTGINEMYKEMYPEKTFEYNWISNLIDEQYKAEYKLQQLFTCFSVLIILLACLGLFGLISFTAGQRVKEISIRKVLGASISNIVTLISKDYIGMVVIAIVIASPIAWYFMQKWLQGFAYRIAISWWMFAGTAIGAILIVFITISFQSVKAAMANPVKSLKSE